jgi:hypothetical protein
MPNTIFKKARIQLDWNFRQQIQCKIPKKNYIWLDFEIVKISYSLNKYKVVLLSPCERSEQGGSKF